MFETVLQRCIGEGLVGGEGSAFYAIECRGDDDDPPGEMTAAKRMVERSITRFGFYPERLIGDSAYG